MKQGLRICVIIIAALICWQLLYYSKIFPELMFPSAPSIIKELINGFKKENLWGTIWFSLQLIGKGMGIGVLAGFVLAALAIWIKSFWKILEIVISVMDPLPGIALLPLAILWFGTGEATTVFIIVHSVIWPIVRSILDGFSTIPSIYVEVGHNLGLNKLQMVSDIYFFASLPSILSGLKIGVARAWRALVSAEMIFGVSGSVGGIGWYIYVKRYQMNTAGTFSALLIMMILGIFIENILFAQLERHTLRKWGMVH